MPSTSFLSPQVVVGEQFWNVICIFLHWDQLDVGPRRCLRSTPAPERKESLHNAREATMAMCAGLWSCCGCVLGPRSGSLVAPLPRPALPLTSFLHCLAPASLPTTGCAPCTQRSLHLRGAPSWIEFGFGDSAVDSEHSPRGEAARARPFLSICGPSSSWSVYTKLQAGEENLQPYHGISGAVSSGV